MSDNTKFLEAINAGYTFKGESVKLGSAMLNGEVINAADILLPLKTMNRHGLIAGATGTGKTKTLQVIGELLSNASVPVLMMDIKGDLSGIAAAGNPHPKIDERSTKLNVVWKANAFPTELLSLSNEKGVRLRATVSEFGPVLLSKILGLNDTQGGLVALIFKYCDDNKMPLLDLKDFIKVLQFIGNEGKEEIEKSYDVLLYNDEDILQLNEQVEKKYPDIKTIKNIYGAIANYLQLPKGIGEETYFDFDVSEFAKNFKIDAHQTLAVLKILEHEGHCSFSESVFLPSKAKFIIDKESLFDFENMNPYLEPISKTLLRTYSGIFENLVTINEKTNF